MPYTVVSFHAHPDDEALYTAGTLARAVADGHRVVLVTATEGSAGLTAGPLAGPDLAAVRLEELRRAAAELGVTDVCSLGYEDSGSDGGRGFAAEPVGAAADRLAGILRDVGADVLTVYDGNGGYGHPDHVQVHRVGTAAAAAAGTPVVLEATVDRQALVRALRFVWRSGIGRLVGVDRAEWGPERFAGAYADRSDITHRVDVRPWLSAKRRAMAAHASQATADSGVRTLAVFGRLPGPLFARVFRYEWFVQQGLRPTHPPLDDIFATLRPERAGGRPPP